MPIIPHSDLTAMTGRDAKALTTSFARSEVLAFQGYKFRRLAENIVEAQGKPTFHKNRKTGETYVDPHGPYIINTDARTCTCLAFANRGGCCHLPYAKKWLESWERGESMTVQLVEISKNPIALREIEGCRYQADSERRVVVFRDWQAAGDYWEREGLTSLCELVELRSVDLEEIAATGRYAGLSLTLADGERQPIPLPEVGWKARGQKGGFTKREDFD